MYNNMYGKGVSKSHLMGVANDAEWAQVGWATRCPRVTSFET
jgi:hypothetical protein